MSATQACSDQALPKSCLERTNLTECTSRKRDNIVLIEIDSDDFGDVIILDVPESFRQKFKKRPKHVISIDDDDDSEGRSKGDNSNGDATTSNRSSGSSSNCTNANGDFIREENKPVKLSASKRTYSGKSVPSNRYGLSSDSENSSSDSEYSDCEFMGESLGGLHTERETASFVRRHDARSSFSENKASTSAPKQPDHCMTEEVTVDQHPEPCGQQTNSSDCSLSGNTGDAFAASLQKLTFALRRCAKQTSGEDPNLARDGQFFKNSPIHKESDYLSDPTKEIDGDRIDGDRKCSQLDSDDQELNGIPCGDSNVEREHGPDERPVSSNDSSNLAHEDHDNVAKSSSDPINIVIDRQKLKETDEYKRAMEEEWASRHQQLQQQAEEVRRLRHRKKAENLRIMANEKRQLQRLAEMRETQKKDEENLNLKDKFRAEIRIQLRRLEITCSNMCSLLRCLGINVGGGLFPSATEVQAAYKRACLKFHPDRFARSDLRQQVEAEEKFKLISNMKDKFFL